jgi:hypothetical protein
VYRLGEFRGHNTYLSMGLGPRSAEGKTGTF